MKITKTFYATTPQAWRRWLESHYPSESEVWLVFYKGEPRHPNISYDDAVKEALCFGWIDSNIQKIDEARYARKFTPRKPGSRWSALNKARVEELRQAGKMTEAGLASLNYTDAADDYGRTPERRVQDLSVPDYLRRALLKKKKAWLNFCALAPSYRRNYIRWISDAKTESTRNKRIAEAVDLLTRNETLGMK